MTSKRAIQIVSNKKSNNNNNNNNNNGVELTTHKKRYISPEANY